PQMNDHTAPAGTGNGRTATRVASDPGAFQKARAEKMAIDARRAARAGGAPRPAHRPREGRAVAVRVRAHVAGPLASVAGAYRRAARLGRGRGRGVGPVGGPHGGRPPVAPNAAALHESGR